VSSSGPRDFDVHDRREADGFCSQAIPTTEIAPDAANEELDRQVVRLDTVFPYIAGEISEEARLGSLTHCVHDRREADGFCSQAIPTTEIAPDARDVISKR
jgi:hypothetical protein